MWIVHQQQKRSDPSPPVLVKVHILCKSTHEVSRLCTCEDKLDSADDPQSKNVQLCVGRAGEASSRSIGVETQQKLRLKTSERHIY